MALHVDLVKNEWSSGYQERVAQLRLNDGKVEVVDAAAPKWREIALGALADLDPKAEPERFFHELADRLAGTYLFATQPHHEKDCPFKGQNRLPAEQLPVASHQKTPA